MASMILARFIVIHRQIIIMVKVSWWILAFGSSMNYSEQTGLVTIDT